jgi:hypothetical protein
MTWSEHGRRLPGVRGLASSGQVLAAAQSLSVLGVAWPIARAGTPQPPTSRLPRAHSTSHAPEGEAGR